MQILADEGMTSHFGEKFAGLNDENFYLVQLEQRIPGNHMQDICGLDQVLKVAPTGLPVVMLGWMPTHMYVEKMAGKWFAANGYPNVTFLLMLATSEEVREAIKKVEADVRPADPLAIKLLDVEARDNSLSVLKHDLQGALQNAERKADWIRRARKHLGGHQEEELFRMVANGEQPMSGPLAGQSFLDVCVDVEGTLLDPQGKLRQNVIQKVIDMSEGRPVTIWTGGDTSVLKDQIRQHKLAWKFASKHSLRGAKVYAIIDDLNQDEFMRTYNVACDIYVQV